MRRNTTVNKASTRLSRPLNAVLLILLAMLVVKQPTMAQTANTGALSGVVTDQSGGFIADAQITAKNIATGEVRTATSHAGGVYSLALLPPGDYQVDVSKSGFKTSSYPKATVAVAETETLNAKLEIGTLNQKITIESSQEQLHTESAQLGTVTNGKMINDLPLAARNYLQIVGLNPGISAEVTNAGDLGRGSSSLAASGSGFSTNGGVTNDNNFQMNGVEVNDNFSEGQFSGGVPVPNPDTIQEFRVVTAPYDASSGRDAGANVDVITKTGSNQFHGSLFEFFRNDDLNANGWFQNLNGQPRQVLKQNQFGGTIGGPIKKDKLLFFGSYQGTRQRNGLDSSCSGTALLPPLTNDRSASALGALFAGQRGEFQEDSNGNAVGPAIAADGSNINPVALKVLQMKLPNGQYVVPTPQTINPNAPFDAQGSASFSVPCPFTEDQYMANFEYLQNEKSRWQGRYFMANGTSTETLEAPNQPGGPVPGFPYFTKSNFRNASLTHTYVFGPNLLNQFQLGFNRTFAQNLQGELFSWSDIGATVPGFVNSMPGLGIANVGLGGEGQTTSFAQNTFVVGDALTWELGRQSIRLGGGMTRNQTNEPAFQYYGSGYYLTFADFLLGLNADQNGTAAAGLPYSNEYYDLALPGELGRYYRYYDANGYVQDDIKLTSRLAVNLGLRFEHLGDFLETQGRNTGLDLTKLNPNPPATGTLAGYVVPSNYQGTPPTGVTQSGNEFGIEGKGQNAFEPRAGFAWRLPGTDRLVLRGGYGMFRSRSGGAGLFQSLTAQPYAAVVFALGQQNAQASLQNPIPQSFPNFPAWVSYSPSTADTFQGLSQNWQPSHWQHYSTDLQAQLQKDLLLDVAYVGGRGTDLYAATLPNQAELASPSNPIRGETTNTVDNVPLRVPYEGWSPSGLLIIQPAGSARYNSLQVSLSKRFSKGLQFLASYTWSRDLTDVPGVVTGGGFGGNVYGNQTDLATEYGPDPFIRPQRLVLSYSYDLPGFKSASSFAGQLLNGWRVAGVTTIQSGHPLFPTNSASQNVYGIQNDRPDYVYGCGINKSGAVQSRIGEYFNTACFTTPPVIGDDGIATRYGDASTGDIQGPGEVNFDFSAAKRFAMGWPHDGTFLEFRADFFNIFNHPIFSDPATDFGTSAFGQITATVVNPRVVQFALKYAF